MEKIHKATKTYTVCRKSSPIPLERKNLWKYVPCKSCLKKEPVKVLLTSIRLCLDMVIKRLTKGIDAKPALFQACMQLANYCKYKGDKKQEKEFRQRAEIFKKLPEVSVNS